MGRRGPPPKPTATKVLQGTFRKDRAPAHEPKPKATLPACPQWLTPAARKEWRRVAKELAALGLLSELDRTALAMYCQALAEYLEAKAIVGDEGITTLTDKGNVIQHPAVGVRNNAWQRVLKAAAEFGMSPSSRTRVSVPAGAGEAERNPFAKLKAG